ncbi:MAG: type II and III secretion system protein family protein [Gammaproteobacteria bacterium]
MATALVRQSAFFAIWGGLFLFSFPMNAIATPITVESGKQFTHEYGRRIERVAVGDPEIADVAMVSETQIIITAKKPGATSLIVWHKGQARGEGPDYTQEILVTASASLKSHALEGVPAPDLKVREAGDKISLSGQSASLEAHAEARQTLQQKATETVDASTLDFNSQVQIDIKIVEISRNKLKNAGIFLGKNSPNTTLAISSPGTLSGIEGNDGGFSLISAASGFFPQAQAFNLIYGNAKEGILGVVSALENNGFAYTLAEPSLVALSGQSANFLAGGEFPVPVIAGGGFSNGITVTYKEFGIRLKLTPTVLDANRIALKVAPEVSELDFTAGIQTGGVAVPALRVRRTDTSIALGDGESFIISGLVSQSTLANVDKLPWLGDIPILGAFFRSTNISRNDRELIMVVSPHLIQPIAKGTEMPPLPGDEFRKYDPDFSHVFFDETGDFGTVTATKSGFSN